MRPANQPTLRPLHDQTNSKPNKNKPNPTQLNKTQPYLPTPNGLSLCMTALPICPRPTMPTVLPLISGLQQHHIRGLLQCPVFLQAGNNVFPIKKFQVQQRIKITHTSREGSKQTIFQLWEQHCLNDKHFPNSSLVEPSTQMTSKIWTIMAKNKNSQLFLAAPTFQKPPCCGQEQGDGHVGSGIRQNARSVTYLYRKEGIMTDRREKHKREMSIWKEQKRLHLDISFLQSAQVKVIIANRHGSHNLARNSVFPLKIQIM